VTCKRNKRQNKKTTQNKPRTAAFLFVVLPEQEFLAPLDDFSLKTDGSSK
jgi:hypothetical protein